MMKSMPSMQWLWLMHRGKILGALLGITVALLIMWARWWSILILACALLGAALGALLVDSHADVDVVDE